jgi:hypothetical protein
MPRLNVRYDGLPSFDGKEDAAVEKVVGKESCGSGYGGARDIGFMFKTRKEALAARRRVVAKKEYFKRKGMPIISVTIERCAYVA